MKEKIASEVKTRRKIRRTNEKLGKKSEKTREVKKGE